jgi:predicted Zn-dependent protease
VIEAIAATGQFEVAKPIIDEFVKQNPGDPALTRMQYRIYLAIKDYSGASVIGEEMIKTDTAAADTAFFTRQAGAYVFAGDTAKALETASRGAQKFPNNIGLWTLVAQFARQTGQMPVALSAIERIVAQDPKTPGINLQKAVVMNGMNQTDQAVEALKAAVAAGDDKAQVAGVANSIAEQALPPCTLKRRTRQSRSGDSRY